MNEKQHPPTPKTCVPPDHPQAQQAQRAGGGAPETGTDAHPTNKPGESNTPGGALDTGPDAETHGLGTNG